MGFLVWILVNAVALLATTIVPGITFTGNWVNLIVAGVLLGAVGSFLSIMRMQEAASL